MTASILITGGTGTLGSHVTPLLRDAAGSVRVLSRHSHEPADGVEYVTGDLSTNEAVAPAVEGIETIVHLAGAATGDETLTRNLTRAATRAGARHLVYISVIGADLVPLRYFRNKLAGERVASESGLPWTTLRAAQFHDLILMVAESMAKFPVVPVPKGWRFEPVDSAEVAARLAELALGEPAGLVSDLAGPRTYETAELMRGYLRAAGKRRGVLPVPMFGAAGRVYRAGGNLAGSHADHGERTWEDFLSQRLG